MSHFDPTRIKKKTKIRLDIGGIFNVIRTSGQDPYGHILNQFGPVWIYSEPVGAVCTNSIPNHFGPNRSEKTTDAKSQEILFIQKGRKKEILRFTIC